jgi:purine-binding chemotaxis protein CheW
MRRVQEGMHVCCRIGGVLVGIDLDRVQEINRHVEPTFVPLMERHVRGVINLRGNLVTVLDLGQVVRGESTANTQRTRTVVVELGDEVCGLVVEEVGDVVDVGGLAKESVPSHLPPEQRRWFTHLVQLPEELLLLLDLEAVGRFGVAGEQVAGVR